MKALLLLLAAAQAPAAPKVFRITPVRPVAELRAEALKATPPAEAGPFRTSDLVEIVTLDSSIRLDIRYAGTDNFLSTPLYEQARAFLQRPAAEALLRVSHALHAQGYGLLIHDAYRPWYITKIFWDATPRISTISWPIRPMGRATTGGARWTCHCTASRMVKRWTCRACTTRCRSGRTRPIGGGADGERRMRDFLRSAMEKEGFTVYPFEWWHFDYKDWKQYGIQNIRFQEIPALR